MMRYDADIWVGRIHLHQWSILCSNSGFTVDAIRTEESVWKKESGYGAGIHSGKTPEMLKIGQICAGHTAMSHTSDKKTFTYTFIIMDGLDLT